MITEAGEECKHTFCFPISKARLLRLSFSCLTFSIRLASMLRLSSASEAASLLARSCSLTWVKQITQISRQCRANCFNKGVRYEAMVVQGRIWSIGHVRVWSNEHAVYKCDWSCKHTRLYSSIGLVQPHIGWAEQLHHRAASNSALHQCQS